MPLSSRAGTRFHALTALASAGLGLGLAEEPLTTALEVRSLGFEAAEAALPVEITGTVIFSEPPNTVFLQDETAGTFFRLGGAEAPAVGDEVRVRGQTFPGLYLPGIEEARFEVLRNRGLPEAHPARYDDLRSGRFHYERVAIEGVVRSIVPEGEGSSLVQLAMGSQRVEVRIEQPPTGEPSWIDSRVRVTGLAAGHINDRRQLVAPFLRCLEWSAIEVLDASRPPSEVPVVSLAELLNFDVAGQGGRRVRVQGTVLASFDGEALFLRDESAIGVELQSSDALPEVGESVEIIGFPEMGRFSATLVDAAVLDSQSGTGIPQPIPTTFSELMDGGHDADLVSIVGTLSDWYRTETGGILVLQSEGRKVQAETPFPPESLTAGALLRVTGICQVQSSLGTVYRSRPGAVSFLVRSAEDIVVLRAPGWWTSRRLATGLFLLLAVVLVAGLWIALLQRQVVRQTAVLRHRIENEAALEERQRIAREFHDTLEQELVGLSLRLDAATARGSDPKLQGFLEGSRSLVSRIQTETRNLVSDLRDDSGEHRNLAHALEELAEQAGSMGPRIQFDFDPELPLLPPRTVHHLKMIAREAVTNAQKHAEASHIQLALKSTGDALFLTITDDGKGFPVEAETRGKSGHFGCMGIRERSGRIGAEVSWKSELGTGTRIEVRLPLPAPDRIGERTS